MIANWGGERRERRLDQAWEVFIGFCCVEHSLADNDAVDPKVQALVTRACEQAAALYAKTLQSLPTPNA